MASGNVSSTTPPTITPAGESTPDTWKDDTKYKDDTDKYIVHNKYIVRKAIFIGSTVCLSMIFLNIIATSIFSTPCQAVLNKPWASRLLFPTILSLQCKVMHKPDDHPSWHVLAAVDKQLEPSLIKVNISMIVKFKNMTQEDWNSVPNAIRLELQLSEQDIPLHIVDMVLSEMQLATTSEQHFSIKDTHNDTRIIVLHEHYIFMQLSVLSRYTTLELEDNKRTSHYSQGITTALTAALFSSDKSQLPLHSLLFILLSIITGLIVTAASILIDLSQFISK